MSVKVPCSKCGEEYTTQGIKNHELRCDGTPRLSKEPIAFQEVPGKEIEIETYHMPEPEPEPQGDHKEHTIEEARIVHKSDVGMGAVIVVLIIFAGIVYVISHIKDIIPSSKTIVKEESKPDNKDSFDNPHGVGWI